MLQLPVIRMDAAVLLRDESDWQLWQFGDSLRATWDGGSARLPADPANRPVLDPVIADSLPDLGFMADEFRMAAVMAEDDREAFLTALGGTEVAADSDMFQPGAETWLMDNGLAHSLYFGFTDTAG